MPRPRMLLTSRKEPPKLLSLPQPLASQHLTVTQFLLHSPLPSPSLPSILPRHGKKPPRLNSRRVVRYLCWLSILITLFILTRTSHGNSELLNSVVYEGINGKHYEIVGQNDLPDFASPLAVTDQKGKGRWTISIPDGLNHPLPPSDYIDICSQAEDVASHVANRKHSYITNLAWNNVDPNYIDMVEAQSLGLLPSSIQTSHSDKPICEKSLTYVLDTSEAGLGQTLLGMWMSWALAKKEHRAFFVDDSNFPFGNYTSLFGSLPPMSDCQLPSWEQRTPCPHHAKHLIVSGSTLKYTFGQSFRDQHSTKQIYQMAHEGFTALFKLRDDDAAYVATRLFELRRSLEDGKGKLVGIHIRRGDRHPFEFQYQHGYIPSSEYVAAARSLIDGKDQSTMILTSDDADLYDQAEVNGTVRAQEHIRLASKKQLREGGLGWEGGFFSDAFWGVGLPEHALKQKHVGSPPPTRAKKASTSAHDDKIQDVDERDYRSQPTPEARQLREYVGRAYLLDLAVLAGSDDIVCAVSSKACRILGVMIGWDRLHDGHWKNVDGDYGWSGLY